MPEIRMIPVDLLTTARGTLVAATRPDDLAAATAYANQPTQTCLTCGDIIKAVRS